MSALYLESLEERELLNGTRLLPPPPGNYLSPIPPTHQAEWSRPPQQVNYGAQLVQDSENPWAGSLSPQAPETRSLQPEYQRDPLRSPLPALDSRRGAELAQPGPGRELTPLPLTMAERDPQRVMDLEIRPISQPTAVVEIVPLRDVTFSLKNQVSLPSIRDNGSPATNQQPTARLNNEAVPSRSSNEVPRAVSPSTPAHEDLGRPTAANAAVREDVAVRVDASTVRADTVAAASQLRALPRELLPPPAQPALATAVLASDPRLPGDRPRLDNSATLAPALIAEFVRFSRTDGGVPQPPTDRAAVDSGATRMDSPTKASALVQVLPARLMPTQPADDLEFRMEESLPQTAGLLNDFGPLKLTALEQGVQDFLKQVENLTGPLTAAPAVRNVSPWLIAAVLTGAACEVARREVRRQARSLLFATSPLGRDAFPF